MPSITYLPTRNVTADHFALLANAQTHTINITEVTDYSDETIADRTVRTTQGGRRKIIRENETASLTFTAEGIDVVDLKTWKEFDRSVNCGERFTANFCDMPGYCLTVEIDSAFMDSEGTFERINAHYWSYSATIHFDRLRVI